MNEGAAGGVAAVARGAKAAEVAPPSDDPNAGAGAAVNGFVCDARAPKPPAPAAGDAPNDGAPEGAAKLKAPPPA